jgi:hypothetical protein
MSIFKKTTVGMALLAATVLLGGCYAGPAYGPRYYRPAYAYGPVYAPAPAYGYYGGGYRRW